MEVSQNLLKGRVVVITDIHASFNSSYKTLTIFENIVLTISNNTDKLIHVAFQSEVTRWRRIFVSFYVCEFVQTPSSILQEKTAVPS